MIPDDVTACLRTEHEAPCVCRRHERDLLYGVVRVARSLAYAPPGALAVDRLIERIAELDAFRDELYVSVRFLGRGGAR